MNFATTVLAETQNYIVLDQYTKMEPLDSSYQTEADLEQEFTKDLKNQGYEALPNSTPAQLLANARQQVQSLNNVQFSDGEWQRFLEEYLDRPGDSIIDKTRKLHDHYIYDFTFDDGHIQNIFLIDKKNIARNTVQVLKQFEQKGAYTNRYDVTILVNGLPIVQVELKKRGVAIREAFNQIHRYSKESFNTEHSLFKYLQVFVISNGTDTRYFANTTKRDKNSFDFTMNWARADNTVIKDLKDFTKTFFQKNTLLQILFTYTVFDTRNILLVMRPYQIAATERILQKIKSSYQTKSWNRPEGGGFIWHTTGSGKTLTSFKAARLATELDFIDKVFFVVDRKDLDYQTIKEYQRFSPESVNGSNDTAGLKENIEKDDNKIIVTTIQKLNHLIKRENNLAVYNKQVVFIFDEAHRSQFGKAQENIHRKFKSFYQFGFTGTPIFPQNALGTETTQSVFGRELHSYVITDAIRDEKVLKFKVDYHNVRPQFKMLETEIDEKKLTASENKQALLHPERIKEVTRYILNNFRQKTHRLANNKGFNAMFAVSSVDAAKLYYEEIKKQQENSKNPLKIATIFSFAANEEQKIGEETANEKQGAIGEIADETFEPTAMNQSAKEFLAAAIQDYNAQFKTNFSLESKEFQNYYRDLSKRVRNQEVDLLIVVGMFLTGFDAPTLNTLFVDKNLRYHGLIQAYSRTNRIYDSTKSFGNIITFRDLEQATIEAITLFGDKHTKNVVLEKSYTEYMQGFTDNLTQETQRGYLEIIKELQSRFPNTDKIAKELDKKDFAKLFGEYLRIENILQNYDEFTTLQALQNIDQTNVQAVEAFKEKHNLTEAELREMHSINVPSARIIQDYRSTYHDVRGWIRSQKSNNDQDKSKIDWNDVVFEVELLKSQEISLDYILELIFEHHKKAKDKPALIEEAKRLIRTSLGSRAKESLVVDFIDKTNLDHISDTASIIEAFFTYAQKEQQREAQALIASENLKEQAAKRYLATSLKQEYASENGIELNEILPQMSPLHPQYLTKKQTVFQKISSFIERFKGVGGSI
ncbi:type I restriction endonuclease subunit R [Entomobacter blattae]|uniref:Type I restriction enzyme endonuclease subunit n=1 Tax=Entomobacter blattae TaxID=2762277 RepID=A0A7H1NRH3_9PROT|nr:type I restriction endonuclease subunit R [Entomobacter blattae]QNT78383.1 Type I restriction enzyme R protein [Entomobacter blattae]